MRDTTCADCGMSGSQNEYHPYAVCLMFKACRNSETVRANIDAVLAHGAATERAAKEAVEAELAIERGKVDRLARMILEMEAAAIARGDAGVPDCMDNSGQPYQSQWAADRIKELRGLLDGSEVGK